MTKTEIEHVLFGIGASVLAICALWAWRRPNHKLPSFLWPSIALLIGIALFFPAETGIGHYDAAGWRQTVDDLFPVDLQAWLAALGQIHVIQHKVAGILVLGIGTVELGRSAGFLRGRAWGHVLPYATIAAGLVLSIHGGSEHHLPNQVEQLHHWIMGVCFVLGGALLALHRAGRLPGNIWRDAWALLVLLAGLDLVLFYRLPG